VGKASLARETRIECSQSADHSSIAIGDNKREPLALEPTLKEIT
jgi:hypothetical protein